MKKRLHHNGQYICDYESTGDDLKDLAAVNAIMAARGLDFKPTPEQAIFRQALSFANISADIFQKYLLITPPDGSGMAPFVVNAVFGIELYLKTLALQHGKKLRGHEIVQLFRKLPSGAKAEIERQLKTLSGTSQWASGVKSIADLQTVLAELDTAFTDWRYLHENTRSKPLKITFQPTIFLAEILHAACAANHVPEGSGKV